MSFFYQFHKKDKNKLTEEKTGNAIQIIEHISRERKCQLCLTLVSDTALLLTVSTFYNSNDEL